MPLKNTYFVPFSANAPRLPLASREVQAEHSASSADSQDSVQRKSVENPGRIMQDS